MKVKNVTNHTLVFFSIISVIFFSSCSKDRIEPENELNTYESLNEYYDSKKQEEQEFVIDTSGTEPIVGKEGTKIWPSKEKLMYPNGDSVKWPYTVKLVELYPVKEMIYYQVMNISGSSAFSCKAEVRVRAFKNGEELVLRQGETWDIELIDGGSNSNQNIYYEDQTGEPINWQTSTDIFENSDYGYLGHISPLGWTSAGIPISGEESGVIKLTSQTDDLTTVKSYVYLPSKQSITEITNQESIALPQGEVAKVICLAIDKNEKLFYYYDEIVVNQMQTLEVKMEEITDDTLSITLNSL